MCAPMQRQAAVVVQEVEAELGAAERRSNRPERDAVLPVVAGLHVVGALRDGGAHRAVGGRQRRVTDGDRVGHRAEAEHDLRRPGAGQVARAEVAADRVDLGLLPGVLVEGLDRRVGRRLDAELDGAHRQQGVAQLGAGHAQDADVDGIDGVDAALDEGALAPVDHLPAGADFTGMRPASESVPQRRRRGTRRGRRRGPSRRPTAGCGPGRRSGS